jgi:hypothetical protein
MHSQQSQIFGRRDIPWQTTRISPFRKTLKPFAGIIEKLSQTRSNSQVFYILSPAGSKFIEQLRSY